MGTKWTQYRLGDITSWTSGGTPSKSKDEYWNGDIPWISASSMDGNRYSNSKLKITDIGLENGSRIAEKDSILLLVRGSILHQKIQVGIAERDVAFNQDVKALKVDTDVVEPWYLLFWFMSIQTKLLGLVENTGIGAGKLDTNILQNLTIDIPEKSYRQKILIFSQALDNKIALNRQINTTLESMAQALFKSWFVDFDPVIDNALAAGNEIPDELAARAARREALRQQTNKTTETTDAASSEQTLPETGLSDQRLPPEIQQLFPDRFVLTEEMGWVPEGWGIESLDRIANYQNGLALQKFRPEDESNFLPVVKIAQLKKGYADGEEKASPNIKPECIIDDGDVVFSWSGSLMVDVWCGGRAALNQHLFKVTSDEYPKWFFLHFTLHHLTEFQRIAADKAVTMGHIKREHLSQAKCSVPGMDFMEKLSPFFDPLLNKAVLSRLENRALIDLRDSLLPKLLSGQITIPDAEQQLAEVL